MPGKILLPSGGAIDCIVRDRSTSGARLKLENAVGIPDEFILHVETTGERHAVRIVWRRMREVGIHFAN